MNALRKPPPAHQRPPTIGKPQHRDNWSREQVKALRKKVKNLRAEIVRHDAGSHRVLQAWGQEKKTRQRAVTRALLVTETMTRVAEQNAWYRSQIKHIARLARSEDWRMRMWGRQSEALDVLAGIAERIIETPLYPDLVNDEPETTASTPQLAGGE